MPLDILHERAVPLSKLAANPFSSCRIRPGALSFQFGNEKDAASVVARLRAMGWWGQIIGPHGTGKSTLIETLIPEFRAAGRNIVHLRFQAEKLANGKAAALRNRWTPATLVIIDGFEQLHWFARLGWRAACRSRGYGLLVTAHRDVGLPTLYETHVYASLAQRVADELLGGDHEVISRDDVAAALAEHRGNLRDALFQLYDVYERKRRA